LNKIGIGNRVKEKSLKFRLFGANLTSLLKAKGISKYKLSKDTKINYRTIQYWGAGKCLPSDKNAELVAAYLSLNIEPDEDDHETRIKSLEVRVLRLEKKAGINLKEIA